MLPHLRTLNCYNRPDYSMIYTCFLRLIERIKVQYDDRYDWETSVKIQPLVTHLLLFRFRRNISIRNLYVANVLFC